MGKIRSTLGNFAYGMYSQRLSAAIPKSDLPRHVGVILDGNRRWAANQGSSTAHGHQVGGKKIADFLGWCEELNIEVVTLWLLSTDNLTRETQELNSLYTIIEKTITDLAQTRRWRIHPVGSLELLPDQMAQALRQVPGRECRAREPQDLPAGGSHEGLGVGRAATRGQTLDGAAAAVTLTRPCPPR